tara:strand:+ start:748 stop:1218 length:471 start_codon:yes stop_codon:yes gene_type:complete
MSGLAEEQSPRLWKPGIDGGVEDGAWLTAVHGQLEQIVGLIPDVDMQHKRDTVNHRFMFTWGEPPISLGFAAIEDLVLEHPSTNMSGPARAGRELVQQAVQRILDENKVPDQVTSEQAQGMYGNVVGDIMDIRWAAREGTVALIVLVDRPGPVAAR